MLEQYLGGGGVMPSIGMRLISGSENFINWSLKTADEYNL